MIFKIKKNGQSSILFLVILLFSISFTKVNANDNTLPLNTLGSTLYCRGPNLYIWQSATDDGTYRYDIYETELGDYTVTVKSVIDVPTLATVNGTSTEGEVDGFFDFQYWDIHQEYQLDENTLTTTDFTINLLLGDIYYIERQTTLVDSENWVCSWQDSTGGNGEFGSASLGNYGPSWWGPNHNGSIQLFGCQYDIQTSIKEWEIESWPNQINKATITERFTSAGGAWLETVHQFDALTYALWGSAQGWEPYLGSFSQSGPSTYSSNSWDLRVNPTFAGSHLWIKHDNQVNFTLLNWIGGSLGEDGAVVDSYSGGAYRISLWGIPRELAEAVPGATIIYSGPGTITNLPFTAGEPLTYGNYTVQNTPPNVIHDSPFFNSAISLWVNGTVYAFESGVSDHQGNRTDTYVNTSMGFVTISGNVSNATSASVLASYNSTSGNGIYSDGTFDVENFQIRTTPPPVGPPAFWVRGHFYSRVPDSNSFTSVDTAILGEYTLTLHDDFGSAPWGMYGYDGRGWLQSWYDVQPEGLCVFPPHLSYLFTPLIAANDDGTLRLRNEEAPINMPPAVMVGDVVWLYVGSAEDAYEGGGMEAYYANAANAIGSPSMLKLRIDSESTSVLATYTNHRTGETATGSYDMNTHMFQTSGPSSGFPKVYGVQPLGNNCVWGLATPSGGLPPTLLVGNEAWRYLQRDENDLATYQGYYSGQVLTLGAANSNGTRAVNVVDAINGDTTGTFNVARGHAELADGRVAYSGTSQGSRAQPTAGEVELHTIAGDLDITGNILSFGTLSDDASMAGVTLQFFDTGSMAMLHNALSRPDAQWTWSHAAGDGSPAPLPVMKLNSSDGLNLWDPAAPTLSPTIKLDPRPGQISMMPGLELTQQTAETDNSVLTRSLGDARYLRFSADGQGFSVMGGINVNTGDTSDTANTVAAGGAAVGQSLQVGSGQVVVGRYNSAPSISDVFVVGAGSSDSPKNALTVSSSGHTVAGGNFSVTGDAVFTGQITAQGDVKVQGVLRVLPAGDIEMGEFQHGPIP